MRRDALSLQSLDFAVSIINLVKELKSKHASVISNQIGRSGTSIGANIREAHSTRMVKQISLQSFKLPLRRQMRLAIGWNCCTEPGISRKMNLNRLIPPARVCV